MFFELLVVLIISHTTRSDHCDSNQSIRVHSQLPITTRNQANKILETLLMVSQFSFITRRILCNDKNNYVPYVKSILPHVGFKNIYGKTW